MGQLEQKKEIVARFAAALKNAEAVVLARNDGLTVAESSELRARLRREGEHISVVKNTLAKRALLKSEFASLAENLQGPLMYGAGSDPARLAKIISEFAGEHERLKIQAGALKNNRPLTAAEIKALAKLPARPELLATLAGTMNAPAASLARALTEVPARFARALAAVRDSKAAGEKAA